MRKKKNRKSKPQSTEIKVVAATEVKREYPRIAALGIPVLSQEGTEYVPYKELTRALRKHKITRLFSKYFGIQTAAKDGPYPDDVEAVLERIASRRLTGTQLFWD